MDQWICSNPDPFQTWWDGGLEDQGWCLACGKSGHKVVCCPFQEEKEVLPALKGMRRRGSCFWRQAREPVPCPVSEREVLPTRVPESKVLLPLEYPTPLPTTRQEGIWDNYLRARDILHGCSSVQRHVAGVPHTAAAGVPSATAQEKGA
ncbi:UNVERIFIED_CONTAM: hypothetical protein FKN15_029668 [Acipenser sinensis]